MYVQFLISISLQATLARSIFVCTDLDPGRQYYLTEIGNGKFLINSKDIQNRIPDFKGYGPYLDVNRLNDKYGNYYEHYKHFNVEKAAQKNIRHQLKDPRGTKHNLYDNGEYDIDKVNYFDHKLPTYVEAANDNLAGLRNHIDSVVFPAIDNPEPNISLVKPDKNGRDDIVFSYRTSFGGDKCPSGQVKVKGVCVPTH